MNNKEVQHGLNPTLEDTRDFSLHGVFGSAQLTDIPNEDLEILTPLFIKDQAEILPDGCTGMSLAACLEDTEGVELDAPFTFAMIKKMIGTWKGYGGDLRSGCKVAQTIGTIQVGQNPDDFSGKPRDFLANWNNWNLNMLLPLASEHKQITYFKVDGPYDTFDNIRAALWTHRADHSPVYTGCQWRPGWLQQTVIPKEPIAGGVGHCFKIANGQKMINGEPHLIIQQSYGTDVGENGLQYISREVVNREFVFGAYMFKDMPPAQAAAILQGKNLLPKEYEDGLITLLANFIANLFK